MGFYYEVIGPNGWLTDSHDRDLAFGRIPHATDTFLGGSFESVCGGCMAKRYICKDMGDWYGWPGSDVEEIDIAAAVFDGDCEYSVFGECRFRRKAVGMDVLRGLVFRAGLVKGLVNRRSLLFSASGFDDELREYAGENHVALVDIVAPYGVPDPRTGRPVLRTGPRMPGSGDRPGPRRDRGIT